MNLPIKGASAQPASGPLDRTRTEPYKANYEAYNPNYEPYEAIPARLAAYNLRVMSEIAAESHHTFAPVRTRPRRTPGMAHSPQLDGRHPHRRGLPARRPLEAL